MNLLLYGTGNIAKLNVMKKRLSCFDIDLIGLKDMNSEIPYILEDGKTPLENAEKKATAYFNAFHIPVFSCDSGLYIDELPKELQPGTYVRRINGKNLNDEEMITYYSSLARKYGTLTARYKNAVCYIKDSQHIYRAMEKTMESSVFLISSVPHKIIKKGFPIDSLSIEPKSGKYFYDLEPNELEQLAVEDGFIDFFEKHLQKRKNNNGE